MLLTVGDRIRIVVGSRHNDWQKFDAGKISRVLATRPQNQTEVYIVTLDRTGKDYWVTGDQVIHFGQLSIFDILQDEDQSATPNQEPTGSQASKQEASDEAV